MNWKLVVLAIALVGTAVMAWLWLAPSEIYETDLTILHTNDVHSHYDSFEPWGEAVQGGAARLATAIQSVRNTSEHVLLLDAGDQFQGTLYFTVGGARVVADVMNQIGYDAMVIGNHEFDSGPAELAQLVDMAGFPIISANVDAAADAQLAEKILPFAVFFYDDDPVAVIGLTSEHTAVSSSPGPDVHFLDVIDTAQESVHVLEAMGINKIIALTHLGYDYDLKLAEAVQGIDIIIGGHTHTSLDPYPTVTSSSMGVPVLIATAYEWGKQLGRLDVTFTAEGVISVYEGHLISVDESIVEDEEMLALLSGYQPAIDALMTTIVGATDTALKGDREDVRVRETNLGDLICDAMLWKTQNFNTTIAIQNGGGIRASIPKGMITMGQVLEVLPYGNQITIVGLSGENVWAALENGVSGVEDGAGGFPHVGGMRYTFDPKGDVGSRVLAVDVWDQTIEAYRPIDPTATYLMATNNFLADGGDGYAMLAETADRYDSGWLLSDALAEHLDAHAPVAPTIEGRIEAISTEEDIDD